MKLINKNTPWKIKQREDCFTVNEIKDFIQQYFDIYERYENRQFGHESNFTLVYKDTKRHTNINLKLIWYNSEDLVDEICLEWYAGWRDNQKEYKKFDWEFDWFGQTGWMLWDNKTGRRNIVENCDIFSEITDFIIKHEARLAPALLREKKLKQLLEI